MFSIESSLPPPTVSCFWRLATRRGLILPSVAIVLLVTAAWHSPRPDEVLRIPIVIGDDARIIHVEHFRAAVKGNQPLPAVVLLHGVEGSQRYIQQRRRTADLLRRHGHSTFVVHYFDAVDYDDLWLLTNDGQLDTVAVQGYMQRDAKIWTDAVAQTLDALADRPDIDASRLAIDGYSLGGFVALAVAERCQAEPELPDVQAVVVNWGACFADAEFDRQFPPTFFVHGELDTVVPLTFAQETAARLRKLDVAADLCIVPQATHVAENKESRQRTLAFLQEHLRAPALNMAAR